MKKTTMNKSALTALVFLLFSTPMIWSQVAPEPDLPEPTAASEISPYTNVALSNPYYPVTPGDQYILVYSSHGQPSYQMMTVSSDYTVDFGIFGNIDVSRMAYLDLKAEIEATISTYFPGSHPQLVLENAGEFHASVYLEGKGTRTVEAWGLTRLEDILSNLELNEDYSSRYVRITGADGNSNYFDFYRFLYSQNETANPIIRPGDRIYISYAGNIVEVSGEVMEPGLREISAGDSRDDIADFVGGFRSEADLTRIQKWQIVDNVEEYRLHDWMDDDLFRSSSNRIRIHIPDKNESREVIFVELNTIDMGRSDIRVTESSVEDPIYGEYIRITVPYIKGMLISEVLSEIESDFNNLSDLQNSFISRKGEESLIAIDLEEIINNPRSMSNIALQPNDILGIPARTVYVTVSGGVYEPGRYFFTPMRKANYYITMAGGINPEENSHRNIVIYDKAGNTKESDALIEPGDSIVVVQDNMVFQFDRKFGTIILGLTFITTLTLLIVAISGG